MKVAVYEGAGSITLQERPDLKAAAGEVIVKIVYCGICGTDVHAYLQDGLLEPGLVLGHENVGVISEVGDGVEGWQVDQRVVVAPPGNCGACYFCRHGHSAICQTGFLRTNGLGPGHDGGLAQFMRVREPHTMLYQIPDKVSFESAVLLDTLAVGLRGIRQSRFRVGDNVAVSGAGAIGLATIQFLKMAGARRITVLEPSAQKRELALLFGAHETVDPIQEGEPLEEKIRSRHGGIGPDVVFECAGVPPSLVQSLAVVRCAGQVLVLGVSTDEAPVVEAAMIQKETDIKASLAYGEDEIEMCLDFLAQGRINTEGLISDIINLDDVVLKGFEKLVASNDLVKIVVAP